MSLRLRLLDEVSFDGHVVTGERSHALLAALAAAGGAPVPEPRLVEALWGDVRPTAPGKALQVVVSRTRAQSAREVVTLVERGYRLGLGATEVDVLHQRELAERAHRAEAAGDLVAAHAAAREVRRLPVGPAGHGTTPLEDLRDRARARLHLALGVLARSASALGDHAEALEALEALGVLGVVGGQGVPGGLDPGEDAVDAVDEPTLTALLRSEAAVHGAPAALARYERHREQVRDRLGVDPGPALQAVHAELLAADRPVREGVRHEATSLVGRDDDLRALRVLVRGSRVVSVLGPGGLGKTRLAHLLGRSAEQPVVHLVELVGVADGDDVVAELGSALGVRDSVSGRRTLTPEQRRDVRSRIAQHLDRAPTLLILDNCEHVVAAVADLVAFLVGAAPRLRVVTTTRAPLGIAAERVLALGQLDDDAAHDLFEQRARAARPGALLDHDAVRRVVRRLDGLPLAVELAAAKVRAMSVAEIDRRLDDRFALLRGSDPSAPDRHRTLVAVIEWSWDLLDEPRRVALGRLALFQDGFDLDAAEAVLGPGALAAVEALVGQSLLAVREAGPALRYRMLETVREFGLQHLGGDAAAARAAYRSWALALAAGALDGLHGPDQVATVRRLAAEDTNLADVLRETLAEPDPVAATLLLAAVGGAWTIRGEHVRIVAMSGAVEAVLDGWDPGPEHAEVAARAAGVMLVNSLLTELREPAACRALLDARGADTTDPTTRATHTVLTALRERDATAALTRIADGPDRAAAVLALQWLGHRQENAGDTDGAVRSSERALDRWRPEDGVWTRAFLQTQLAGLHAQAGESARAAQRAAEALDVLDQLGAHDDATQLRALLAGAAVQAGRLDEAERLLGEMAPPTGASGAVDVEGCVRAELALARGDVTGGLAAFDRTVEHVRSLRFAGLLTEPGQEPWTLFVESTALSAHVRHGPAGSGAALRDTLAAKVTALLADDPDHLDYPIAGSVLFALGAWELRAGRVALAVRTLALAERFAFSRYLASMSWSWVHGEAERAAPGALDAAVASYGARRGRAVLDVARALAADLTPDQADRPA